MCNPRRVRVRATRQIAEAWSHEVRRQVVRAGQASAEARVREPLGPTVGGPALAALASVLGNTPGWRRDGDRFVHDLDGGQVIYHPLARELEIVASVSVDVSASGEEVRTLTGEVRDALEAEGVGVHYDDNWGGITEDDARREAQRRAQTQLDVDTRRRLRVAAEQAEAQADRDVADAAGRRADAALVQVTKARSRELRHDAEARLAAIGVQGRNVFHQALAGAYRDVILAFARSRRAERVSCTENGGVVDIEFELQI